MSSSKKPGGIPLANDLSTRPDKFTRRSVRGTEDLDAPLEIGQVVGPFRIDEVLGEGGMGKVYKAVRVNDFDQTVALKVFTHLDHSAKLLMAKEIKILANLQHNHISHLIDADLKCQSHPWMALEYIEGCTLDTYLERENPSIKVRLNIFLKICDGLAYAHNQLIIHRDIKPGNILITPSGEPKLLDFGIAAVLDPTTGQQNKATARFERYMTPEYASPEQADGRRLSVQSDVYSMGVLLYEMLTGVLPYRFESRHPSDVLKTIFEAPIHKPSTRRNLSNGKQKIDTRQLKGDLDTIVLKAMQRDIHNRYKDISTLAADIQAYLKGLPIQAQPATFSYLLRKFIKRNSWPLAFACSLLVSLVAFSIYAQLQNQRLAIERDRALQEQQTSQKVTQLLINMFQQVDPEISQTKDVRAIDILDEGSRLLRQQLNDAPQIKIALTHTLGQVYRAIGDYDAAEKNVRDAIALNPKDVAVDLKLELVGILIDKGEFREIEKHLLELEKFQEQLTPTQRTRFYILKGNQTYNTGEFHVAREWFNKAADHKEHLLQHEQTQLAARRIELYSEMIDFPTVGKLALDHADQVLEIYGKNSAHYAEACIYLSVHNDFIGDREKGLSILQEGIDIVSKVLKDQHPLYIKMINLKSQILVNLRRYKEALELGQKAYDLAKLHLAETHPLMVDVSEKLALMLQSQGDHNQAEKLIRENISKLSTISRTESLTRLRMIETLAVLKRMQGLCNEAIKLNHQVINEIERNFSSTHPIQLKVNKELFFCYQNMAQFNLAEKYGNRTVEISRKSFGEFSQQTLIYELSYIIFLSSSHHHNESLAALRDLIDRIEMSGNESILEKVNLLTHIGNIFARSGYFEEARTYYSKAVNIDKLDAKTKGYERNHTPEINLIQLLAKEGRILEGRELFIQTLQLAYPDKSLIENENPYILNNVGWAFSISGDYHLAEPYFQAAIDLVESHPDYYYDIYGIALSNIIHIEHFKNNPDLVRLLFNEYDQIPTATTTKESPALISRKELEVRMHLETQNWEVANHLICEIEGLIHQTMDPRQPSYTKLYLLKAESQFLQGKLATAETILEKIKPVANQQENLLYKTNFKILKAQVISSSSPAEALRLLAEAVIEQNELLGPSHPSLAETYTIYADLLSRQNQELDYAVGLAKEADYIFHALLEPDHPKRYALENLIHTLEYQRNGDVEDEKKAAVALNRLQGILRDEHYLVRSAKKRAQRFN